MSVSVCFAAAGISLQVVGIAMLLNGNRKSTGAVMNLAVMCWIAAYLTK